MKNIIKNILYFLISRFNYDGAVILLYHSVSENGDLPTVRPDDFNRQLNYLKINKFNVIKLTDLFEYLANRRLLPPKTVCLTFDDGYEDNYSSVFPILKKHNFPATIFISTALIDKASVSSRGESFKYLNEPEIKAMSASGLVDFGSHSHNHWKLSGLSDDRARLELETSKNILEKLLNKKIVSLAYPVGRFKPATEAVAKKLFKIICTVKKGRIRETDYGWRLKRNSVDAEVNFTQFKGIVKFGRI